MLSRSFALRPLTFGITLILPPAAFASAVLVARQGINTRATDIAVVFTGALVSFALSFLSGKRLAQGTSSAGMAGPWLTLFTLAFAAQPILRRLAPVFAVVGASAFALATLRGWQGPPARDAAAAIKDSPPLMPEVAPVPAPRGDEAATAIEPPVQLPTGSATKEAQALPAMEAKPSPAQMKPPRMKAAVAASASDLSARCYRYARAEEINGRKAVVRTDFNRHGCVVIFDSADGEVKEEVFFPARGRNRSGELSAEDF